MGAPVKVTIKLNNTWLPPKTEFLDKLKDIAGLLFIITGYKYTHTHARASMHAHTQRRG